MIDEKKLIEERPENLNPLHETHSEYNKGWNACNSMWVDLVHEQPKVEKCADCNRRKFYQKGYEDGLKADKWIPCSERLPEEDVDVLLCVNDEYDNAYFTVAYHHIVWQTEVGGMYGEVVAWMPLPPAFEERK